MVMVDISAPAEMRGPGHQEPGPGRDVRVDWGLAPVIGRPAEKIVTYCYGLVACQCVIFKEFDFILTPTTPHTAFDIDRIEKTPTEMYLEDIYTVHANLSGIPAISLPLGTHSNNMPFGIQIMAPSFKELELLAFSKELML